MARVSSSNIRSGPSRKTCYLRFTNNSSKRVNVIWVDYSGTHRYYGTLEPSRHFDIHTYEGHPWICEDNVTKRRMMLNNGDIFVPKSTCRTSRPYPHPGPPRCYVPVVSNNHSHAKHIRRQKVSITVPVFSLKELCSGSIIKYIARKEDIGVLHLPNIIKTKLFNEFDDH